MQIRNIKRINYIKFLRTRSDNELYLLKYKLIEDDDADINNLILVLRVLHERQLYTLYYDHLEARALLSYKLYFVSENKQNTREYEAIIRLLQQKTLNTPKGEI